MRGRQAGRRRHAQARRRRRFEVERPTVRAVVREGASWATVNTRRLPGLVLALACLALVAFMFADTRFYVYGAEVTGNRCLATEEIYEASGADMHSVFFVAPQAVRQRLLERLPVLSDVRVSLDLPTRLRIEVVESKAQFAWEVDGQRYLADERGRVLSGAEAPPEVLHIRCTEGCAEATGGSLDRAVLDTVRDLSAVLGGARTFEYSARYGVCWRNGKGWLVRFGVGGDLQQKVAVMQGITAELVDKGIQPEFLDVGVPSRPYYR